jgi:small subunit ribosomal protein S20
VANHKDALKRARQSNERRLRNRHLRSRMRNQIKALRAAIETGDADKAQAMLPETVSIIQHVAQKGVIHKRNAARRVSRLAAAVNKVGADS